MMFFFQIYVYVCKDSPGIREELLWKFLFMDTQMWHMLAGALFFPKHPLSSCSVIILPLSGRKPHWHLHSLRMPFSSPKHFSDTEEAMLITANTGVSQGASP